MSQWVGVQVWSQWVGVQVWTTVCPSVAINNVQIYGER